MTVLKLKDGETARLSRIDDRAQCHDRLLELGFVAGEPVTLVRRAPFGGPVQLLVRSTSYAIGRDDANFIFVESHSM